MDVVPITYEIIPVVFGQEAGEKQVGRTPAFIGHVEAPNIQKAISLDTLFEVAEALDVPAYKFLLFDPDDL